MRLLIFAGSLRVDSCNKKFAREALRLAKAAGADGEFLDLKNYPMPVYDGDIETTSGIPEPVKQLGKKILAADALVISTPEYNGSIPGILKNVIDWLSRDKPVSLENKHLLLLAASPGALGGMRSLWHSRQPFEVLSVHVFPNMMALPNAYNAFDEQGKLKDEKTVQRLQSLLEQYIAYVKRQQAAAIAA
jgi:NAD(P)H-dependent FMN reductase